MSTEKLPKIEHGDVAKPDLEQLGSFLANLVGAGDTLFPDEDLENYMRQVGGLPEKSDEARKQQEQRRREQQGQFPGGQGGGQQPPGQGQEGENPAIADLKRQVQADSQRMAVGTPQGNGAV